MATNAKGRISSSSLTSSTGIKNALMFHLRVRHPAGPSRLARLLGRVSGKGGEGATSHGAGPRYLLTSIRWGPSRVRRCRSRFCRPHLAGEHIGRRGKVLGIEGPDVVVEVVLA